jgi:hypothetical protein
MSRELHNLDTLSPEYNILKKAGSSLGYKHSEEFLAKMSLANSGARNPMHGRTGKNHPFIVKFIHLRVKQNLVGPKKE